MEDQRELAAAAEARRLCAGDLLCLCLIEQSSSLDPARCFHRCFIAQVASHSAMQIMMVGPADGQRIRVCGYGCLATVARTLLGSDRAPCATFQVHGTCNGASYAPADGILHAGSHRGESAVVSVSST